MPLASRWGKSVVAPAEAKISGSCAEGIGALVEILAVVQAKSMGLAIEPRSILGQTTVKATTG